MVLLDKKCGLVNTTSKKITEIIYNDIFYFYYVELKDKYSFIDENYNVIIECKYDNIISYKNGFFKVQLNNEYFWINQGETIKIKTMKLL